PPSPTASPSWPRTIRAGRTPIRANSRARCGTRCSSGCDGCSLLDVELRRDVVVVHGADADARDVAPRAGSGIGGQPDRVAENAASLDGEAAGVGTQHLRGRIPVIVALSPRHRDAQEIVRRQYEENGRLTPVGDREERDRVHARLPALRAAPGEAVGNPGERDV